MEATSEGECFHRPGEDGAWFSLEGGQGWKGEASGSPLRGATLGITVRLVVLLPSPAIAEPCAQRAPSKCLLNPRSTFVTLQMISRHGISLESHELPNGKYHRLHVTDEKPRAQAGLDPGTADASSTQAAF